MKTKFKFLTAALLSLALFTLPATADIGTKSFGITNTIAANATHTSAANVGGVVKVDNRDNVGLEFKFAGAGAGTDNITVILKRSVDGVTFETHPRFTWIVAQTTTTPVVAYTNLSTAVIGAAGYLAIHSIQNGSATIDMTNASLKVIEKSIR